MSNENLDGEEYYEFSLHLGVDPINFWNGTFLEDNIATFRLELKDVNEECDEEFNIEKERDLILVKKEITFNFDDTDAHIEGTKNENVYFVIRQEKDIYRLKSIFLKLRLKVEGLPYVVDVKNVLTSTLR